MDLIIASLLRSHVSPVILSSLQRKIPAWGLGAAFLSAYVFAEIVQDYRGFVKIQGGLPQNVFGWAVQSVLRLFKIPDTRISTFTPAEQKGGYLGKLPNREGPRPEMYPYTLPHRAIDQIPPAYMADRLQQLLNQLAEKSPTLLSLRQSELEGHHEALFGPHVTATRRGKEVHEIAHVHPHDRSLHLVLHPADAHTVITKGWGEYHPLSGQYAPMVSLPKNFVYIYAPRDEREFEIVQVIVEACVTYDSRP